MGAIFTEGANVGQLRAVAACGPDGFPTKKAIETIMAAPDLEACEKRRGAFFDAMVASGSSAVAVLPSAPVFLRNNDVEHEYRQDSDFFYLTGFDEPESVLVLDAAERKTTLLVRPRDRERGDLGRPPGRRRRSQGNLRRRRGVRHRGARREAARLSSRTAGASTVASDGTGASTSGSWRPSIASARASGSASSPLRSSWTRA